MAIVIERPAKPVSNDPITKWIIQTLTTIRDALVGLLTLDANVRETRTLVAERAVALFGIVVDITDPTTFLMREAYPDSVTQNFTTALIVFDATSGAGRWRSDGVRATVGTAPGDGLQIPQNGYSLTVTGADNIRDFSVAPETATPLNMTIQFYK